MGVLTFLLRLSPVWDAIITFWRTKIGKGVILTVAALVAVWMYGAWAAREAVEDHKASEAARDAAATRERDKTLSTIRKDTDDALIDRLVGPR